MPTVWAETPPSFAALFDAVIREAYINTPEATGLLWARSTRDSESLVLLAEKQ